MKLLSKKSFIFSLLLFYMTTQAQVYGENYASFEGASNPLDAGSWDLQVQAGVDPILWTKRSDVFGVNTDIAPDPLLPFFQLPRFSTLYHVPWIIGGQVGYHWCDNERIYVEFNYMQARGKDCAVINTNSGTLSISASKYKLFDGYVGVRYYFDRWCDYTSFFIGGKLGFVHHKQVNFSSNILSTSPITPLVNATPVTNLFNKNTAVSIGGNIGLDIRICGCLSLVLTGEVVASCGPSSNIISIIPAVLGVSALTIGSMQTEIRFPITAGLRYSF